MDMIVTSPQVNSDTISAMVGYLQQRSSVCAKVVNAQGDVLAVNRRGLELLNARADDVCGKMWTAFWEGDSHDMARIAVRQAFAGEPAQFVGEYFGGGDRSVWEVEAFPLERDESGAVNTILVLSVNITQLAAGANEQRNLSILRALSETLHAVSNLSTISASSARMLSRKADDPLVRDIARGLDDASKSATAAVEMLRDLARQLDK